ncbi:MAG: peptide ABC transporter substrate-binding protein [Alicyclobacillus herbarius]|uniref:peptide ABC transporter substrate-binding protein n=1 Tax=Alicyclobacillus herbarius TaxID=122960 RepID=UPI002355FEF0|nr:peptide ABC transporter substrate-binding protein [Alicyclobacillus herbarius]MCL6632434.1 peptide ABC transporter substrate-binding protein [Alicyclobacillus herbarius]
MSKKLNKRKYTAFSGAATVAIAMTASLTLAGCSSNGSQKHDSVTVGLPPIPSLDPTAWQAQILIDQGTVLEGLTGYDKNLKIVPKVADHWTTSDDGLTWTFYLRKDAKWSNGDPVTAHDFYYAWMRMLDPKNTSAQLWASFLPTVKNATNYHTGSAKKSDVGIKVINDYEIQIQLQNPNYGLPNELALASAMPLDPKVVDKHPTNWYLPQYFVGNGPYVVSSFKPNGKIVLTRNKHYVGNKNEVNVGNVQTINIVPTPTSPLQAYKANQLDVVQINNPSDFQYAERSLKNELHEVPNYDVYTFAFDKAIEKSPLDNPLVRKAIAEAIDRNKVVKALSGMANATDVFGPSSWPATKYQHGIKTNVADAKKLLAQAGYPNGKGLPTFELYTWTQTDNPQALLAAESIQQQLKQNLNINFKIEPTPSSVYGGYVWGNYKKDVKPGYMMFNQALNWPSPANADLGAAQASWYDFHYEWRNYVGQAAIANNNPYSVTKYGNPDDKSKGISWSDWVPLEKAYQKDAKFLMAYANKQTDPDIKKYLTPIIPYSQTWNGFVQSWKDAKTDADKHQAWVNAWNWIGSASNSAGATDGLDMQVWKDQHRNQTEYNWFVWNTKQQFYDTDAQAAADAGRLAQSIIDNAWMVPLYDSMNTYLTKPFVHNVVANRFAWGNVFQLQYMTVDNGKDTTQ